jgi:hypothetical protein
VRWFLSSRGLGTIVAWTSAAVYSTQAHGGAPEKIARPARVGMRVQEDFSFFDRCCRSVGALDGTNNRT